MSIFGSILDAIRGIVSTKLTSTEMARALDRLAKENPERLNWRRSIVDLMKLVKLESSLRARKELAAELGHKGAFTGTAKQNMWLHSQVLDKLAAHGGDSSSMKGR